MWIVKAPGTSRGQGIQVCRKLSDILSRSVMMGGRVVQKYIETPLIAPHASRSQNMVA